MHKLAVILTPHSKLHSRNNFTLIYVCLHSIKKDYVCGDGERMNFFETLLLSMALSADAFAIGVACEMRGIRTSTAARLVICFVSAVITAAAVFLGSVISDFLPVWAGNFIGIIMMFALGAYVIYGAIAEKPKKPPKPRKENILTLAVKPLGITIRIIRNPAECDIDHSSAVDFAEACYMGVALSADSFAAGLGAGVSGGAADWIPLMCGIFQLVFLCCGAKIGKKFYGIKKIKQKYLSIASGAVLIAVALFRIFF